MRKTGGNTTFSYELPSDGNVTLSIENILGANVVTLVNGTQTSGTHVFNFDANSLAPGVYTATLQFKSADTVLTRTIKVVCNQ